MATRTSRNGCTVDLFQRFCCFLITRRAMISLIALSTMPVEIGSPMARPIGHQRRLVRLEIDDQIMKMVPQCSDTLDVADAPDLSPSVHSGIA